jgi:predicted transcriptional regulator
MTPCDWELLISSFRAPRSIHELADFAHVSVNYTRKRVRRLARLGLMRLDPDPKRKRIQVSPTYSLGDLL